MSIERILNKQDLIPDYYFSGPIPAPAPPLYGPVIGVTDGVSIADGFVGQVLKPAPITAGTPLVSNTNVNIASFTVPAGSWLAFCNVKFDSPTDGFSVMYVGWSNNDDFSASFVYNNTGSELVSQAYPLVPQYFNLAVPTAVSLTAQATFVTTAPAYSVQYTFIRIR
jgi:hypothetical protein